MTSSVLLGFGLLAVFFGWRYILTPTLVDHYRDKLFDLRDEVRQHYAQLPEGLKSPDYKAMRDLLNSQILYIERASIFGFAYLLATAKKSPETADAFKITALARLEREPDGSFSHRVRNQSSMVVLDYAAKASLTICLIAALCAPFVLARDMVNLMKSFAEHSAVAGNRFVRVEFAPAIVAFLGLMGLQGQFKPSIGSIIEKAAKDNAHQQAAAAAQNQARFT